MTWHNQKLCMSPGTREGLAQKGHNLEKFPIACVVLALDSWKYCSGEQGQAVQHLQDCLISFKQLNHVYTTKTRKIRCCHPMITLMATRWHTSPFSMKPHEENNEEDVGLFCFALQSNSSNCLRVYTTETIGKLFAQYWRELLPNSTTFHVFI